MFEFAFFQSNGNLLSLDFLNIMDKGMFNSIAASFKTLGVAHQVQMLYQDLNYNLSLTVLTSVDMSSKQVTNSLSWNARLMSKDSLVKVLVKNLFNISTLFMSDAASRPSRLSNLPGWDGARDGGLTLTLEFTYLQKALDYSSPPQLYLDLKV